jgi:microcystin degradation protein MlrC
MGKSLHARYVDDTPNIEGEAVASVFAAALGTETNTFSPLPTGWTTFAESLYVRRDGSLLSDDFFVLPLKAWRRCAEANGDAYVESIAAYAQPAGRTVQAVWERLREELLGDLRAAGPVDIVLLNLHGAMASEQCDDCEGELIEMVRSVVGKDVTIGVELDLHCHITDRIVANADVVVLYKHYPHTDTVERANELYDLARRTFLKEISPVTAVVDCRMLGVWRTSDPQIAAILDYMKDLENRDGVLSASFAHGFPWADVADVGAKVMVVTDGDNTLAGQLAQQFSERVLALRESYRPPLKSMETAVAEALSFDGLTVIADISDNAGGGAANDSTFMLAHLLEVASATRVLFGVIWDPLAVRICEEAGEGATLDLRIGGKVGPQSGDPIDLRVEVKRILRNATMAYADGRQAMGTSVAVSCGNTDIVMCSVRTQTYHPDAYTQFGLDPARYRIVVAKSAQHFHAGFAPLTDHILYAVAPGSMSPDFVASNFTKTDRRLWPISPE